MNVHDTLTSVFASVFGPHAASLADDDGPGSVEGWDSIGHLNLILAIESAFGIEFTTAEIPELTTVGLIRARIARGT